MEKGGLGRWPPGRTLSTNCFIHFLWRKKEKDIHVTSKGRQLLELVPEDLKAPALTADWERSLWIYPKAV